MEEAKQTEANPSESEPKPRRWLKLVRSRKVLIGGGVVIALMIAVIIAMAASGGAAPAAVGTEVTLGEFQFASYDVPGALITEAKFRLHVSLLRRAEEAGTALLEARQFKVQQEVEQLLRRAKSADFEDPLLADLKRQMQEMINETVGARVIEEVIITDLSLKRSDNAAKISFGTPETGAAPESAGKSAELSTSAADSVL